MPTSGDPGDPSLPSPSILPDQLCCHAAIPGTLPGPDLHDLLVVVPLPDQCPAPDSDTHLALVSRSAPSTNGYGDDNIYGQDDDHIENGNSNNTGQDLHDSPNLYIASSGHSDEGDSANCDGEGEVCYDIEDALWTYPEMLQGRQSGKRLQSHSNTAHGGKQENCGGKSSGRETQSSVDRDIALEQLLSGDPTQSVTKGDLVTLASAILDLHDAITQHGARDPTPATSKSLPATQPASTIPEPVEDSDDPKPDYKQTCHNKTKLGLQENVQRHAVYLLKRKNRRQPFPKVASPNDTALYAATGQGGPTAQNFCLDFHGPLTSPWNKHVAEVFASHFFDCGWYGSPKKEDIKRVFKTHMCTLCAQYVKLHADNPPDEEQSQINRDEEKEKGRVQRRQLVGFSSAQEYLLTGISQLRHRRANACSAHVDLACFSSLWKMLSPEAMSGDETDHQPGQKHYAIKRLSWQSQAATEWLNFYDATWLLMLDDDTKTKLRMLPEADLTHTAAVLDVAEKYKCVRGRKFQ
ncbi:hypothetical protein M404DRAFT_7250 [Pisolithus tinctorius Marx 270]|uniref:Uncharacterized protein n=1 Tax=Pisolithus tinctorius Marx 270 TaxID=870435 RepID=A0A0C3JPN3_PISTI|nr:hypothetical protein M404DRAFT_7250 [Pisolithus tinctorius Marx 270]